MANFKPNGNKKNIGMIVITILFLLVGTTCIVIACANDFISWLMTFGIVILVIASPIVVYILYTLVIKKIKDM